MQSSGEVQQAKTQVLVSYPWSEMVTKLWASESTRTTRRYQLKHWEKWMESKGITGIIDFEDINQYLFEMRKSSQADRKIAIKAALKGHPLFENDLRAQSMIDEKFKQIRTVKVDCRIKESDYLLRSEVQMILDDLYKIDTTRSLRSAIVLESLFQTACRVSEFIGMTHDDVKHVKDRVEIRVFGKNSKIRTVMMTDFLYEMIQSHFGKRDYLLSNEQGKQMTRHGVHQQILYLSQKYLGRKLGPHALRHSKAMEMLGRGVSIKKVSGYLGHSDVSTTLRYYVHETASAGDVLG